MPDLTEFLSDDFQYKLKAAASANSNSRFENALDYYFDSFFEELNKLQSAHAVNNLDGSASAIKSKLYDWVDCVRKGLQEDVDLYKSLFKDLAYAYQLFIRGKHYHATLHIFDVLEKYDMTDVIEPGELGLYYKGRTKRDGDIVSDEEYYYHISFDKRFLVSNQRFSYSGQPILYIGSSILDVLYELRCGLVDYQKISFASFGYDPLIGSSISEKTGKKFPPFKIYDVTNHIYKTITQTLYRLVNSGFGIPACDDDAFKPNIKHLKKDFKKFILTQICTFKRNHSSAFVEEYIPAQILTEALRINGYHGIKFPSTQFDGKSVVNHKQVYPSAIQENLALFTTHSKDSKYDYELMKYFFVKPIDETSVLEKTVEEYRVNIQSVQGEIAKELYTRAHSLKHVIGDASMNLAAVYSCEAELEVEGKLYFEWDFARLELFAQAAYLTEIKNQTRYFADGKQNTFPMK